MERGVGTRRWIAGAGGVAVNAFILGGLALLERSPPAFEIPVMIVALERTEREPRPAKSGTSSAGTAVSASASSSRPTEGALSDAAPAEAELPAVDPAWRVDPEAVERWKITEGSPEWGWGRYRRACNGSTSEHMTQDEKERCYDAWGGRREKRPSPQFIGPIDEREWQDHQRTPQSPSRYDQDAERQERCRTYRRLRNTDPSMLPSIRQGGCF